VSRPNQGENGMTKERDILSFVAMPSQDSIIVGS